MHVQELAHLLWKALIELNVTIGEYPSLSRKEGSGVYGDTMKIFNKIIELDTNGRKLLGLRTFASVVSKLQALFGAAKSNCKTFSQFLESNSGFSPAAMMMELQGTIEALKAENELLTTARNELHGLLSDVGSPAVVNLIADVKANIDEWMGTKITNSNLDKGQLKKKLESMTSDLKSTKKKLKDMNEKFAGIKLTSVFIQRLKIYRKTIYDSNTEDIIEYILKVSCLLYLIYCVFRIELILGMLNC